MKKHRIIHGIFGVAILGIVAVISVSTPAFYSFFYFEWHGDYSTNGPGSFIGVPLSIMFIIVPLILFGYNMNIPLSGIIVSGISTVLYYFLIGVLAGWVMEKIRSGKTSSKQKTK